MGCESAEGILINHHGLTLKQDYMMCIAALLSIIGMIIVIFEVQNGGGRWAAIISDFSAAMLTSP